MLDWIKSHGILLLLILVSAVFYLDFAYNLERSDFIKLIGLYGVLFFLGHKIIQISKANFWFLAGLGIVFRLVSIVATPNLSQDFYRFLWDGRLLIQGVNPYLLTPEFYIQSGQEIVSQANELYSGMGALNASHFSNYPPINQFFFAIAAVFSGKSILGSVIVLKVIMILADVGILYFGKKLLEKLNMPVHGIFWYFLNPFIIIELTGNLHFEGVMLFFVVWSLYLLHQGKWLWAGILLAISISVKLIPLLLLPLFLRFFFKKEASIAFSLTSLLKFYTIIIATVVLTFLPFLSSEFASNFAATIGLWFQNFEFNASIYYIIRWIGYQTIGWNIIETVGKILPLVVIGILLSFSFFRKNNTTQQLCVAMLFGISCYFLLSTTVHPWYIATPLLLSVFTNYKFPIVWSLMVVVSYSAYGAEGFSEKLWLVALEYIVVIGFFIWEFKFKKQPLNSNAT